MTGRSPRSLASHISRVIRLVFFDPVCRMCGKPLVFCDETIVCRDCAAMATPVRGPVCCRCGKLLNDRSNLCGDCMLRPPVFARNLSYGLYDGALKDLILLYKYGELQPLSRLLASYLLEVYKDNLLDGGFDSVLAVPPDPGRRREFDPLSAMAKIVARKTGIPYMRHILVKKRNTEPQSTLPLKQRLRNLDGAFELKRRRRISGKNVLLIDDVFTTGTTIKRCAELLVQMDAAVTVLTLARSV